MRTAEAFWKAAKDIRSGGAVERVAATVTLLEMAFGPEGTIQKRATEVLRKNSIAVVRGANASEKSA